MMDALQRIRIPALAIALIPALLAGGCAADTGPIRIAVAGPLGEITGRSMRLAAELAIDEINQQGGLRGRRVELIARDDEANPQRAIEIAIELRDNPSVVAVVGHVNSNATLAAADFYNDEKRGLVAISPASSSPLITHAGPWIFRVCPSDLLHGPALARWAYDRLGARRVTVLYSNDEYGRGVIQSFGEAFRSAGGEVLSNDPYLPATLEDPTGIDPYIIRALRSGMDALVIVGQADAARRIITAARRLGYNGPVLGPDGLTNLRDFGEIAEGVYISSAFLPDRPDPNAQAFVRAYVDRYRELPDHRGAMTYDAIRLIARAIAEVGTDRTAIRDYIATVGRGDNPPFEGVSGTIRFDENGDVVGKEVIIGIVRGGQLVTAGS
ncbi:MAG TPA: ABC transporter substrate-binding protein [Longimicrobiales bacterium]